jgi:RNA polymerase sigma-70 factor (ECF subfamily)
LTEISLVERAQGGDSMAYEQLVRSHSRRLFLVAQRILRDTDSAEDVLQKALVTIWRQLPRLRECTSFEGWSYRIVTRAALDEAKLRKRTVDIVDLGPREPREDDRSKHVEDRDAIERAFDQLTPEKRAVVVLRFYADLPVKEIGLILDIPPGTVASRLSRAMDEMRTVMDEDDRPPGASPAVSEGPRTANGVTQ